MTDILFEIEVPIGFVGPVRLNDGRILGLGMSPDFQPNIMLSADGGRTWSNSGPMIDRAGRQFTRRRTSLMSLIRLASGALALNYWEAVAEPVGMRTHQTFFQKSLDEGKTWSDPIQVTWPNTPSNPTYLVQTRSGRLVLPNEYSYNQATQYHKHNSMKICTVLYSDDEGETWAESADSVFVGEKDRGAHIAFVEAPCIVETADGRLLMFMRTEMQRLAQSYSIDGGVHWEQGSLNALLSSRSEVWLDRIPTTGDLLCVWNQVGAEEIRTGFYRSRLSSAISKDSGATWHNFRTVVMSPGMKRVDRIVETDPPAHLTSSGVSPEKGPFPKEGHRTVRHPRVRFIDDKAYLRYDDRRYDEPHSKSCYSAYKLRAMPISWFYGN